jgi:hypothetical protein
MAVISLGGHRLNCLMVRTSPIEMLMRYRTYKICLVVPQHMHGRN